MANKILAGLRESEARRWDAAEEPMDLLSGLAHAHGYVGPATPRKLQLFTSAVCRHIWARLPQEQQWAVGLVESFVEGECDGRSVVTAIRHLGNNSYVKLSPTGVLVHWAFPLHAPDDMKFVLKTFCTEAARHGISNGDQAEVLRGILGNPYRAPKIVWRGVTADDIRDFPAHILHMARRCYEDRLEDGSLDRARLWVLSDALEDEGMEGDLLGHLREEGAAWRGWWSLDYVLAKE